MPASIYECAGNPLVTAALARLFSQRGATVIAARGSPREAVRLLPLCTERSDTIWRGPPTLLESQNLSRRNARRLEPWTSFLVRVTADALSFQA
jgi:hypothetical protein